ncbi:MAG: CbiX/SirB N-terminal domain-containing protein [Oligoflexus sp.]
MHAIQGITPGRGVFMKTCLMFIAHGSRAKAADIELQELIAAYRHSSADSLPVYWGYVEISSPNYQDVLEDLALEYEKIIVIPLALFAAGHVKNDMPLVINRLRKKHPSLTIKVGRPLGIHPLWIRVVEELLRYQLASETYTEKLCQDAVLIVVGRGSSDPDANSDFFKIARLIAEGLGIDQVIPCFIGITQPDLPKSLEIVARLRPKRVVVLPFMLFSGRLLSRIEDQLLAGKERYPWLNSILLPRLSQSSRFLELLQQSIRDLLGKELDLACVSCQYRVPLGRIQSEVGGLRSLLWSLRHSFTHRQAVPHTHAHRNMRKHILVCTNSDCVDRGALPVLRAIRQQLREQNMHREFRITRTSCLGRCGEGPTAAVYPDGIWYRQLDEAAGRLLVKEHLLEDRLLSEYVDNIMT